MGETYGERQRASYLKGKMQSDRERGRDNKRERERESTFKFFCKSSKSKPVLPPRGIHKVCVCVCGCMRACVCVRARYCVCLAEEERDVL